MLMSPTTEANKTRFIAFFGAVLVLAYVFWVVDPRITSLDPEKAAVQNARHAVDDRDYRYALDGILKDIKTYPYNADLRFYAAEAYAGLGQRAYAISQYQAALQIQPLHGQSALAMGELYLESGQLAPAQEMLGRLQTLCPQAQAGNPDCDARNQLAAGIARAKAIQGGDVTR